MKKPKNLITAIVFLIFSSTITIAQNYKVDNTASKLEVLGTSNIHDWEITANTVSGQGAFTITDGVLTNIDDLTFVVVAESLKSGKSGMDKNTYKALNTDKHKNINYKLEKCNSISAKGNNTYNVNTTGKLTIAGVTQNVTIPLNVSVSGNTITLSGDASLKMTSYKIEPPTAMFGSIKTGDAIKVKFNAIYKK